MKVVRTHNLSITNSLASGGHSLPYLVLQRRVLTFPKQHIRLPNMRRVCVRANLDIKNILRAEQKDHRHSSISKQIKIKSENPFLHLTSLASYHSISLLSFSAKRHENVVSTCYLQFLSSLPLLNREGVAPSSPQTLSLVRSPMTSKEKG